MRLNGQVVTVIGVTRAGFIGINGLVGPDLWLPFALGERLLPSEMRTAFSDRGKALLLGVGRLKPGVTVAQAQANVDTVASALAREYPAANEGQTVTVRPIGDVLFGGGSNMARFAGVVLATVAAIVLLIACSNVANLMLARSGAREAEMAVRMALGASRARLARQLLTESLCYGLLGGGVGVLLAFSGVQMLAKTLPASGVFVASRLDTTVLLFALFTSLAAGVLFGAIPALTTSRAGASGVFNGIRTAGRSARRVSVANALLVGQVALSLLLLVTAALFLRSIQRAYESTPVSPRLASRCSSRTQDRLAMENRKRRPSTTRSETAWHVSQVSSPCPGPRTCHSLHDPSRDHSSRAGRSDRRTTDWPRSSTQWTTSISRRLVYRYSRAAGLRNSTTRLRSQLRWSTRSSHATTGLAKRRWASASECRASSRCGRLSGSPAPPTTRRGESRRRCASISH